MNLGYKYDLLSFKIRQVVSKHTQLPFKKKIIAFEQKSSLKRKREIIFSAILKRTYIGLKTPLSKHPQNP